MVCFFYMFTTFFAWLEIGSKAKQTHQSAATTRHETCKGSEQGRTQQRFMLRLDWLTLPQLWHIIHNGSRSWCNEFEKHGLPQTMITNINMSLRSHTVVSHSVHTAARTTRRRQRGMANDAEATPLVQNNATFNLCSDTPAESSNRKA